jgi:hypothetical protein
MNAGHGLLLFTRLRGEPAVIEKYEHGLDVRGIGELQEVVNSGFEAIRIGQPD